MGEERLPVPRRDVKNGETLRIQICPKKGINPTILLWGWDWDHQTYSREGFGSLGKNIHLQWRCVSSFAFSPKPIFFTTKELAHRFSWIFMKGIPGEFLDKITKKLQFKINWRRFGLDISRIQKNIQKKRTKNMAKLCILEFSTFSPGRASGSSNAKWIYMWVPELAQISSSRMSWYVMISMSCYIKFWIQKHLSLLTQVKNFHGAQWGLPSWAIDESLFTEKNSDTYCYLWFGANSDVEFCQSLFLGIAQSFL